MYLNLHIFYTISHKNSHREKLLAPGNGARTNIPVVGAPKQDNESELTYHDCGATKVSQLLVHHVNFVALCLDNEFIFKVKRTTMCFEVSHQLFY